MEFEDYWEGRYQDYDAVIGNSLQYTLRAAKTITNTELDRRDEAATTGRMRPRMARCRKSGFPYMHCKEIQR